MRKLLLAAVATAAIASPAAARDGSGYVGVDLGAMIVENMRYDYEDSDTVVEEAVGVDSETGFDLGLVGGYDFGMFRVEGELAYKRASIEDLRLSGTAIDNVEDVFVDADGRHTALSAMANVLFDMGDENDWSGFVGAPFLTTLLASPTATQFSLGRCSPVFARRSRPTSTSA
jgi:OmpA-OmpF porin, OOP family